MANAGRILILAKGAWSATTNYTQLDMVSYNSVAYLARQASVGVDPSTDVQMNYWMPFGSAAQIATTSTPGLVMPDGTSITITNTGLIKAVLGLNDVSDVTLSSLAAGDTLVYNATTQKWENSTVIQTLTNQVKDMNNVYGSKNLLPYPYDTSTVTKNNVSFTDNGDGTITISTLGNRSSNTFFNLSTRLNFGASNWILSGSSEKEKNIGSFIASNGFDNFVSGLDFGYTASNMQTWIVVSRSAELNNVTIKPMIRLASITDDTYEPYAKTNQQLTQDTTALLDNTEVNGAVNMLPYPYKRGNEVINGITSVVDSDGVITLNGTAEATTSFIMFERVENKFALPKGSYKAIVKIVSGTYTGTLSHILRATEGGSGVVKVDKNLGEAGIFSISTDTYIGYQVNIPSGSVLTNLKLAPMITVASYTGDYVPYAKSNKELTEDVAENSTQIQTLMNQANNKVLYLTGIACSATTGNFVSKSDSNITANHVVASVEYANPSAITTDVTWTTANGSVTLNGTCASATTCSIVLVEKDN